MRPHVPRVMVHVNDGLVLCRSFDEATSLAYLRGMQSLNSSQSLIFLFSLSTMSAHKVITKTDFAAIMTKKETRGGPAISEHVGKFSESVPGHTSDRLDEIDVNKFMEVSTSTADARWKLWADGCAGFRYSQERLQQAS